MTAPAAIIAEELSEAQASELSEEQASFSSILTDEELDNLFDKYDVADERRRKLPVRWFFWLMVFSAAEPSRRGSLLQLIGFFLGGIHLLFPESKVTALSKMAVSKRLSGVSWYLFQAVYNHLLERYHEILGADQLLVLGTFKEAFAIDGSVIALSKQLEDILQSVHRGKASLKLNTMYSLKVAAVTKLQVSSGKRHDSRFSFVTKQANCLYLVDLGYWSYGLMKKIIDAGSFFVMRLKGDCDPLIVKVDDPAHEGLIGRRLSEIGDFLAEQVAGGLIDLTVQLSKAKKPRFTAQLRLVGLFHEEKWHFYVTNIFDEKFTPKLIYKLYAQRWQVEIFFNLIKNVLNLENIVSRTKNGIMIEIYSALIFYVLTRIVIARAAQKSGQSIHAFSFERSQKLIGGFMLSHFHLFLQESLRAIDTFFHRLIDIVARLGLPSTLPKRLDFSASLP